MLIPPRVLGGVCEVVKFPAWRAGRDPRWSHWLAVAYARAGLSVRGPIIDGMGRELSSTIRATIREQAGIVGRQQLLRDGVNRMTIVAKLKSGQWRQVHHGVYMTYVGELSRRGELWAAVLYAGRGAMLSHETAAEILGITDRRTESVDVTVPAPRRVHAPQGVTIHSSSVDYPPWRPFPGYPPHTFFEETVVDLVDAAEHLDDAIGWVTRAMGRRLTKAPLLMAAMSTRKRLRWRREVTEFLKASPDGTESALEYRFDRGVVEAHGLPAADGQVTFTKANGRKGRRDRAYAEYRLLVELDGKQYHGDERRGEDQDRDNHAAALGNATLRYGWRDVTLGACESAAQLYTALRQRGYRGTISRCSPGCRAVPQFERPARTHQDAEQRQHRQDPARPGCGEAPDGR